MATGKIKMFNGFGFISPDDGSPEVFVHISALPKDLEEVSKGQAVSFDMGVNARNGRPRAENVQLL